MELAVTILLWEAVILGGGLILLLVVSFIQEVF